MNLMELTKKIEKIKNYTDQSGFAACMDLSDALVDTGFIENKEEAFMQLGNMDIGDNDDELLYKFNLYSIYKLFIKVYSQLNHLQITEENKLQVEKFIDVVIQFTNKMAFHSDLNNLHDNHVTTFTSGDIDFSKKIMTAHEFKICMYDLLFELAIINECYSKAVNIYFLAKTKESLPLESFPYLLKKALPTPLITKDICYQIFNSLDLVTLNKIKFLDSHMAIQNYLSHDYERDFDVMDSTAIDCIKNLISWGCLVPAVFKYADNTEKFKCLQSDINNLEIENTIHELRENYLDQNENSEELENKLNQVKDILNKVQNTKYSNDLQKQIDEHLTLFKTYHYERILEKPYSLKYITLEEDSILFSEIFDEVIKEKEYEKFNNEYKALITLDDSEIQEFVMKYFNDVTANKNFTNTLNGKKISENMDAYYFHHSNEQIFEFIKNNSIICSNIALSTKLIFSNKNLTGKGDYTAFVCAQIKTVERLIKEILVQKYPRQIYKFENRKFNLLDLPDNPTVENLSHEDKKDSKSNLSNEGKKDSKSNLSNKGKKDSKSNLLTLGPSMVALAHCLYLDENHKLKKPNNYHGCLFWKPKNNKKPRPKDIYKSDFSKKFKDETRNGYFHVDIVENIKDAMLIAKITAYWTMRLIDDMLDVDSKFKLRKIK